MRFARFSAILLILAVAATFATAHAGDHEQAASAVAPSVQHHESPVHSCGCDEILAFVVDYVERNYAGFQDKVSEADRQRYDEHRSELRAEANGTSAEAECHELLRRYVGFFQDPHLGIARHATSTNGEEGDEAIRANFADWPARHVSEAEVRGYLDGTRNGLSSIEGIWEIVGSDYRLAVLPAGSNDGSYEAVTLRADGVWWVPGQIKATFEQTAAGQYQASFYMRDHSLREETAHLRQGLLVFSGVSPWARVYPENTSGYDPARYRASEQNGDFEVRMLDASTVLLRLPTFEAHLQARVDSMVEANWDQLTAAHNLIIDVRGNPGGSVASFRSVLPLLYTGPMVTPGISHYATDDNIRAMEGFVEEFDLTEALTDTILAIAARMREHHGGFVPTPDVTLQFDSVLPYPRRVAVLTNRWCASSCESLVWSALQSDKTTVFGESTGGVLDYGDAVMVDTPCPSFRVQVPTARSNRVLQGMPLDNVGIEPTVRVPEGVLYWLEWVHEQLQ